MKSDSAYYHVLNGVLDGFDSTYRLTCLLQCILHMNYSSVVIVHLLVILLFIFISLSNRALCANLCDIG